MSGGVKMHFKSVSVYVNLSKNSLSPKYGMHKTLVPFLPLCFICTVLSMWKMSACDWKAPYLLSSPTSQRSCSFTYDIREELLSSWISKETLKIQIEMGLEREAQRRGNQDEHSVSFKDRGTRPQQGAFLPARWPGHPQPTEPGKRGARALTLYPLSLLPLLPKPPALGKPDPIPRTTLRVSN